MSNYDSVLDAIGKLLEAGEIEKAVEKAKENPAIQFMLGEYLAGKLVEDGKDSATAERRDPAEQDTGD